MVSSDDQSTGLVLSMKLHRHARDSHVFLPKWGPHFDWVLELMHFALMTSPIVVDSI